MAGTGARVERLAASWSRAAAVQADTAAVNPERGMLSPQGRQPNSIFSFASRLDAPHAGASGDTG
jgi:hypothetical protein